MHLHGDHSYVVPNHWMDITLSCSHSLSIEHCPSILDRFLDQSEHSHMPTKRRWSQVHGKQRWRQLYPKSHHKLFPIVPCNTPPLFRWHNLIHLLYELILCKGKQIFVRKVWHVTLTRWTSAEKLWLITRGETIIQLINGLLIILLIKRLFSYQLLDKLISLLALLDCELWLLAALISIVRLERDSAQGHQLACINCSQQAEQPVQTRSIQLAVVQDYKQYVEDMQQIDAISTWQLIPKC